MLINTFEQVYVGTYLLTVNLETDSTISASFTKAANIQVSEYSK